MNPSAASRREDGSPAKLDPLAGAVIHKAKRRLIWLIVIMYCVAYLDRVNVGLLHWR